MKIFALSVLILSFSLVSFSQCKDTSAQRAEFAKLSSPEKAKLWRDHLNRELETRKLEGFQINLIRASILLLTDDFYDRKRDMKFWKIFRQELRANFSLKEGSEIFEQLPELKASDRLLAGDCNCSSWWTFCRSGWTCSTSCAGCTNCTRIVDCGPFWAMTCDGKCVPE